MLRWMREKQIQLSCEDFSFVFSFCSSYTAICFFLVFIAFYIFANESSTHSLRMGTKHFFPSGENKIIWKRFNSEPELIRFALLALVSGYTQRTTLLLQVGLFVRREKCTLPLRNLQSEWKLLWRKLREAICKPSGLGIRCRAVDTGLPSASHSLCVLLCRKIGRVILFAVGGSGISSKENVRMPPKM